jgi:hypothetical protein
MARHNSNTIIKFADDTAVVGLKPEARHLAVWCQDNKLSINMSKTKEMTVDYRKRRAEHAPIHIDQAVVERVKSLKFLGVHITNKLSWSQHTKKVIQRA